MRWWPDSLQDELGILKAHRKRMCHKMAHMNCSYDWCILETQKVENTPCYDNFIILDFELKKENDILQQAKRETKDILIKVNTRRSSSWKSWGKDETDEKKKWAIDTYQLCGYWTLNWKSSSFN